MAQVIPGVAGCFLCQGVEVGSAQNGAMWYLIGSVKVTIVWIHNDTLPLALLTSSEQPRMLLLTIVVPMVGNGLIFTNVGVVRNSTILCGHQQLLPRLWSHIPI